MMRFLPAWVLLVCSGVSLVASAQSSRITGVVTDSSTGRPIGDAAVSARTDAAPFAVKTRTDAQGRFELSVGTSGTYDLEVSRTVDPLSGKASYRTLTRSGLEVRPESAVRLVLSLVPERTKEGEPPSQREASVDPLHASQSTFVSKAMIDRLALVTPNALGQRSFESLMAAAPQVSEDRYGFGVSGSQSPEVLTVVDGMTVSDPVWGTLRAPSGAGGVLLPTDFLEHVTISTGALSAAWGRASGVVNASVKSGSNELRGAVWGNWWPGALTARPAVVRNDVSSLDVASQRHNTGDFGAELGGALIQDRLWFYVGVAQANDRRRVTRTIRRFVLTPDGADFERTETGGLRVEPLTSLSRFDDRRALTAVAKLTLFPNEQQRLSLTAMVGPQQQAAPGIEPSGLGGSVRTTHTTTVALSYAGRFADHRLLVDATVGYLRSEHAVLPSDGSALGSVNGLAGLAQTRWAFTPRSIRAFESLPDSVSEACEDASFTPTRFIQFGGVRRAVMACPASGGGAVYLTGGPGPLQQVGADRLSGRASVGYRFAWLGQHLASAGVDIDWTRASRTRALSGGEVRLDGPKGFEVFSDTAWVAGPDDRVKLFSLTSTQSQLSTGAFLSEQWSVMDAFSLDVALRYDTQQLFDGSGRLGLTQNNVLSPRIGLAYDFTQRGRSRLFANYAAYHQAMPLSLAERLVAPSQSTRACEGGCAFNDDPLAVSPTVFQSSNRLVVDPQLRPMTTSEIVAGLEYETFASIRLGVVGTHRWLENAIETFSTDDGSSFLLGNPGVGLGDTVALASRRLFAGTLFVTRHFADGLFAQASYTLSSLVGNDPGFFRPESGEFAPAATTEFDVKSASVNRFGPLPADRTHQVKVFIGKDFALSNDLGLSTAATYEGQSGTPLSYLATHPLLGAQETYVFHRGSAGRTPWTHTVNARVALAWRYSKEQAVQFSVDVYNLFNLQEPIEQSQQFSGATLIPAQLPDGVDPQRAACIAGNDPRCSIALQKAVGAQRVPAQASDFGGTFKQPTLYQSPLSVRLGVKLSF